MESKQLNNFFDLACFLQTGSVLSLSHASLLIGWGKPFRITFNEIDLEKPAFYFPDFFLKVSKPWIQYSHWMEISHQDLYDALKEQAQSPFTSISNWSIHGLDRFQKAFEELYVQLESGKLKKAVPYLFATTADKMNQARLHACLIKALSKVEKKIGNLYGSWENSSGILGITPEVLFSHRDNRPNQVKTMALAGTCPLSRSLELFMNDEKERLEHGLVVEGIAKSLKPLGKVHVGKIGILQLPKLAHLMTSIEIELHTPFDFDRIVKFLHPTPALGAFPLVRGKIWLKKFDHHTPRGFYGAPVGYKYRKHKKSECFVAIRNVQWDESGMRIGAGCGVVAGSTYEHEQREILLKIDSIKDFLDL